MSWQLGSTLIVRGRAGGRARLVRARRPPSRLVALVAALAALAVAGRVLFAPIPNVQATTDVALLSGYALGPAPGFMVGAIAALASNFFLGQGPWTPWQMLGWGAAGVCGSARSRPSRAGASGRWPLAVACALAGLAFGAWMDLFTLIDFAAERSADGYVAIAARLAAVQHRARDRQRWSLCLAFGPAFVRMLVAVPPPDGRALAAAGGSRRRGALLSVAGRPALARCRRRCGPSATARPLPRARPERATAGSAALRASRRAS